MVMVSHKEGGKLLWRDDKQASRNVLSFFPPQDRVHPNEKPVKMVEHFIIHHTPRTATILDPFMGSGTTGVACMNLGRKFIGIEIEPKYFNIACRRIEQAESQGDLFIERVKPEQQDMLK